MPLYAERETPMSSKPKPEVPDMHHVFVSVESTVTFVKFCFVLTEMSACEPGGPGVRAQIARSLSISANFEILGAHFGTR